MLDLDTGGGELLASLAPPAGRTVAVEGWAPNVDVATHRLAPLGVEVVAAQAADRLPLPDRTFDLVLNRHGRLCAPEIARVLRPGGRLLTQQVGSDDCTDLNTALDAPPTHPTPWNLAIATAALTAAGLRVVDAQEARPTLTFADIGAVVFHLRMVAWQVPDFDLRRYDGPLRRLHAAIQRDGHCRVRTHRFLLVAELDHQDGCTRPLAG